MEDTTYGSVKCGRISFQKVCSAKRNLQVSTGERQAASCNTYAALSIAAGMIKPVNVKAVLGNLGPLRLSRFQTVPELLGVACIAGEAEAQPYYRNVIHDIPRVTVQPGR